MVPPSPSAHHVRTFTLPALSLPKGSHAPRRPSSGVCQAGAWRSRRSPRPYGMSPHHVRTFAHSHCLP
jgi:hypothetical protein